MAGKAFRAVKVRIHRGSLGEDLMVYPARYNAYEVDRNGIGPLSVQRAAGAYSGHIGLGGGEAWCFIILPMALAEEYATDPDMEIVTPEQADADMDEWRRMRGESNEIVLDSNRVAAIQAKQAAKIHLTQDDHDALNPDSPMRGINRRLCPIREKVERIGGTFK